VTIARKERRRFNRIYFTKDAGITGTINAVETAGKNSPLSATIMNLSAEGAELYLKRTDGHTLNAKNQMTLEKINGCEALAFCKDIEFEIKRIVDIEALDNILLGCYFNRLSESTKSRINDFVLAELEKQK
jgi:c-di-GMP-binding flagellar brake protein YcgR